MSSHNKRPPSFPSPIIIDSDAAIARLRSALTGIERIAVDTESNSLHAYHEQICLIQLSTVDNDYLIDPLRLDVSGSLAFFGDVLADPAVEKILHAAEYDVMCLRRDFNFEINNLFDTMVAASILGWEAIGLGPILEERYDITVNKRHQLADWARRPLTPQMRRYAQIDTHFLIDLRHELHALLEAGGHLEESAELFQEVTYAAWPDTSSSPDDFWQVKRARRLKPQQAAILRELYIYREEEARQLDLPVFKVIGDKALVEIARTQPANLRELGRIQGVGRRTVQWHGQNLLDAIERGLASRPPERPKPNQRPSDAILERYDRLHTWRKNRAGARGVSSEIIMAKDTLWELARNPPRSLEDIQQLKSIGPWRASTYGQEILELFQNE